MEIVSALIFTLLSLTHVGTLADLQCQPAEEGKRQILSHQETYDQFDSVAWEIYSKTIDEWVSICVAYNTQGYHCDALLPDLFAVSQPPNELTILNVSRKDIDLETSYRFWYGASAPTCQLKVYAPPSTLTCDAPRLSTASTGGQGRDVIVTCSTDKVYPKPQCAFKLQRQTVELQRLNYTHQNAQYDGVEYYKSSCTLTHHVTGAGSYAFDVDTSLPTAVKSPTCPEGNANDIRDGYIRNGATATCLCIRDTPGLPEGKVLWYKDNGNTPVGSQNSEGTSSRLTIPQGNANYVCKGTSDLGTQQDGVTYAPKFAYGPTSVTAPTSIERINLCPTSHKSVTMNCSVSVSNVAPYPLFRVVFDGNPIADKENGSLRASEYIFTKTLELTSGGEYDVYCRAENAFFPDISVNSHVLIIDVQEPPRMSPFFRIRDTTYIDKSNITVDGVENSTVVVECQVDDGTPLVNSVTLKCGSSTTSATDKIARHVITISKEVPVAACSCSAQHVTNCYVNNKSDVTLIFTFKKLTSSELNDDDTAVIAVGITAAILFVIGIVLVFIIIKRKGMLGECKKKTKQKKTTERTSQAADGSPYENTLSDTGVPNISHYETIPDKAETTDVDSLSIQIVSDSQEKIEYENTVTGL